MTQPHVENVQRAPYPHELAEMVSNCQYRPGWTVRLEHIVRDRVDPNDDSSASIGEGLTLLITTRGYDSYHPERGETYRVNHPFIVPAATYDARSWRRWLFNRFLDVETHEAMEFFALRDDTYAEVEWDAECKECDHAATKHDGRVPICVMCSGQVINKVPSVNPEHHFEPKATVKRTYTRPYAPNHGPGNDPYLVREPDGTLVDQRTSFRGLVKT